APLRGRTPRTTGSLRGAARPVRALPRHRTRRARGHAGAAADVRLQREGRAARAALTRPGVLAATRDAARLRDAGAGQPPRPASGPAPETRRPPPSGSYVKGTPSCPGPSWVPWGTTRRSGPSSPGAVSR